jgi:hypothetical protein
MRTLVRCTFAIAIFVCSYESAYAECEPELFKDAQTLSRRDASSGGVTCRARSARLVLGWRSQGLLLKGRDTGSAR